MHGYKKAIPEFGQKDLKSRFNIFFEDCARQS
jgi:hypothetical protein